MHDLGLQEARVKGWAWLIEFYLIGDIIWLNEKVRLRKETIRKILLESLGDRPLS